MAPERKYPQMSRQEMIEAIQKLAEELGRSPSQADMKRAGVPWHRIYSQFGGMRQAVRAAGLEPGPRGEALNEGAMILDWAGVVRRLRRLPSRAEYDRLGQHHSGTLHARLDWSQMAHRFVLMVVQYHLETEWGDVVTVVVKRYPLLKSTQQSALSIQPLNSVDGFKDFTHHGDTETRRTAEAREDLTAGGAESAEENLKGLPLIDTEHTDQEEAEAGSSPPWIRAMGWRKIASGVMAIQMLIAMANGGTQQLAVSNWQLAVSQNKTAPKEELLARAAMVEEATQPRPAVLHESSRGLACAQAGVPVPHESSLSVPCSQPQEPVPGELSPVAAHNSVKEPVVYGAPLGLAAMAHAPTNEGGVMFLFGVLAERLGFRVERIQTAYPDCEAKREVRPGVWERVRVEFEFESRNFREHRHDWRGCEVIVCWRHNWPECPRGIEVVELSRYAG